MYDVNLKYELFPTKDKAEAFIKNVTGGSISHYAPNSKTKEEYIRIFEKREKYFDEDFAELFPYAVSYIEIIEK